VVGIADQIDPSFRFARWMNPEADESQLSPRDLCNRLAEHPDDENKEQGGVSWNWMHADHALVACRQAAKDEPTDPKVQFQLGRVLNRLGNIEEAVCWYIKAAEQGYPQAQRNLTNVREEWAGVQKNHPDWAEQCQGE
jgi:TPR repeat protein